MKRILFILTIPSPYRVAFFNELGKRIELTVLFEKEHSKERDESWKKYQFENFKGIVMKSCQRGINKAFCPEVRNYLTRDWDEIVCCNATTTTGMLAIRTLRHRKIQYWIEGDGAFAKSGHGIIEKIKKYLYKDAKGYFSTSLEHDKYYETYGADRRKIVRYPFSSVSESNIYPNNGNREKSRRDARKEINAFEGTRIVLIVGQFIYRKGFDILLRAIIQRECKVEYYFVGGNPTDEYVDFVKSNNINNVHFIGFKNAEDLKLYYLASDIFVLPTREDIWGLVINEAMAYGLPVVTTDRCIAGLEMIKNGENGYIVPVGDSVSLSNRIVELICNDSLREKCGKNALTTAHQYTIETMVMAHLDAWGIN